MADEAQSITGTWGTVSYQVPLGDKIDTIIKPVNDVAQIVTFALQVAIDALDLSKAYTVGYLDPMAVAAQALVDVLNGLAKDLGRVGIYVSGDWNLMAPPFKDLAGGYGEYERRMIARLTDKSDLTRPIASPQTQVVSLFLYVSADINEVHKIIKFVQTIMDFFHISVHQPATLPTPIVQNPLYGLPGSGWKTIATAITSKNVGPINTARLRWKVAPTVGANPVVSLPSPPPGGFVVCVSTVASGIRLVYDRPGGGPAKLDNKGKPKVQPREHGVLLDEMGKPIILHGGSAWLELPPNGKLGWNDALDDSGNIKNGYARIYGLVTAKEDKPIPLDQLKIKGAAGKDTYLFQRTFYVESLETVLSWTSGQWSIDLNLNDLPQHAEVVVDEKTGKIKLVPRGVPTTFYVRIAALTKDAVAVKPAYDLASLTVSIHGHGPVVVSMDGTDTVVPHASDIGTWSRAVPVTIPGSDAVAMTKYLEAVQAALIVLVLCRADLPVKEWSTSDLKAFQTGKLGVGDGVAALPTGLESVKGILTHLWPNMAHDLGAFTLPGAFRKALWDRVQRTASDLVQSMGSNPIIQNHVANLTESLRTATWRDILGADSRYKDLIDYLFPLNPDMTILDMVKEMNGMSGLAASVHGMGVNEQVIETLKNTSLAIDGRSPQFFEAFAIEREPLVVSTASSTESAEVMKKASPGMRKFYAQSLQADGTISMSPGHADAARSHEGRVFGSGDNTPVLYGQRENYTGDGFADWHYPTDNEPKRTAVVFCRTAIAGYKNGAILKEAALTLNVATAALGRPPWDGAWKNIRLKDGIPALDDLMQILLNWIKAVQAGISSASDAVSKQIDFLKTRIADLQQMIQRINALWQMLSGLAATLALLPPSAGLLLMSDGTDGTLSDFVAATNKPEDGPQDYAAGIAIVVMTPIPTILLDMFKPMDDASPKVVTAKIPPPLAPNNIPAPVAVPDDQPL